MIFTLCYACYLVWFFRGKILIYTIKCIYKCIFTLVLTFLDNLWAGSLNARQIAPLPPTTSVLIFSLCFSLKNSVTSNRWWNYFIWKCQNFTKNPLSILFFAFNFLAKNEKQWILFMKIPLLTFHFSCVEHISSHKYDGFDL